jgi:hypothetical protein
VRAWVDADPGSFLPCAPTTALFIMIPHDDLQTRLSRIRYREMIAATATLAGLVVIARLAGVKRWFPVSLWAFVALWTMRSALLGFRVTGRRRPLIGSAFLAGGAVCLSVMDLVHSSEAAAFILITGAAALIAVSVVVDLDRNPEPHG